MRKKSQRQNEGESTQIRVRFERERRASRLSCVSLGNDNEACQEAEL